MIYNNFEKDRIISMKENSVVILGKDNTCIKKVNLSKCFSRLDNEAKCLKILNGHIAPKLIEYDGESHELRMEYIQGLTLLQYINKYGEIPKYFFAKVVSNLLKLLDYGIEYGGDKKIEEHFIIVEENEEVRIIDFGLSNIYEDRNDIINYWKDNYKREFAFVFMDAKITDIEDSKTEICQKLYCLGIHNDIAEQYFENCEKI